MVDREREMVAIDRALNREGEGRKERREEKEKQLHDNLDFRNS